ncbi:unnamed protein product [Vitrella brassicaformis CCMP3155]|uniref:Uncharacterized protein n=1 Tax=Vitrella brassicaformis (strain CCMP3155) TaxID=1169540 RepID=A0A0G4EVY1_VITBC|nr:unnamed protein product [Vitrella brassicaformis CCMP3155]|eukprot:CEM02475.1 unnamed protein product [Vitrella brassicaformis CCMP3155]
MGIGSRVHTGDLYAALIGVVFGTFSSYIVTNALIEVSFNRWFSVLFGTGFLFLGGLIIWRAHRQKGWSTVAAEPAAQHSRTMLHGFAGMIILSGLFCFLLEKDWFCNLSPIIKIPMYSLLGVSLSFALTFAFLDALNLLHEFRLTGLKAAQEDAIPLGPVHTPAQICALIFGSLLLGLIFGFFFGSLDVEDDSHTHVKLMEDRYVCTPIAAVLGLVTSVVVRRLGGPYRSAPSTMYTTVGSMDKEEVAFFADQDV